MTDDAPLTSWVRGIPRCRASTGRTAASASVGISRRKRCTGSSTRVPASARARASTTRVRARKSPAVLDIAVEGDRELLSRLVQVEADQGVLLGQLGERGVQGGTVALPGGHDDRLQRGWCEGRTRSRSGYSERIADPDVAEPADQTDPPGRNLVGPDHRAPLEKADSGDFAPSPGTHVDLIPRSQHSGEHPRIGQPLTAAPRSILNTTPESSFSGTISATGSNAMIPARSASTPAPVIAEPKNTG
jgi:hypothetical protein